jgi:hypothetical protein
MTPAGIATAGIATGAGRGMGKAHAAGISPTTADRRRVITVDLVGTALLVEALRPLVTAGTAMVCHARLIALHGRRPRG